MVSSLLRQCGASGFYPSSGTAVESSGLGRKKLRSKTFCIPPQCQPVILSCSAHSSPFFPILPTPANSAGQFLSVDGSRMPQEREHELTVLSNQTTSSHSFQSHFPLAHSLPPHRCSVEVQVWVTGCCRIHLFLVGRGNQCQSTSCVMSRSTEFLSTMPGHSN